MKLELKNLSLYIRKCLFVIFIVITSIFSFSLCQSEASSEDVKILFFMQSLGNLPEFCKYKIAETELGPDYVSRYDPRKTNWPPKFGSSLNIWKRRLGVLNWTYIHHYCFGIRETNKLMSMDIHQREKDNGHQAKRALSEFEFVRRSRASQVFPFYYKLYRYEYILYSELGDYQRAQWALKQSLRYKKSK